MEVNTSNLDGGNCVEVADGIAGVVPVRDSKRPAGAVLAVPADAWREFVGDGRRWPLTSESGLSPGRSVGVGAPVTPTRAALALIVCALPVAAAWCTSRRRTGSASCRCCRRRCRRIRRAAPGRVGAPVRSLIPTVPSPPGPVARRAFETNASQGLRTSSPDPLGGRRWPGPHQSPMGVEQLCPSRVLRPAGRCGRRVTRTG
ncbi:DUF397 domain-containing protein [Streptomyces aidingensis]|uniref:DUF397 domain-containing protein n=1 Tax=Streptomyces aidingensis TaxID=910347 RepID=UPI000B8A56F1